jgi:N-methylhydantoinase B
MGGTAARRAQLRAERLAGARPAVKALSQEDRDWASGAGSVVPLCYGVGRRGSYAISLSTGALLAQSPDHWTDGCRVLEERRLSSRGRPWIQRSYLDPLSGAALFVEAVPVGSGRSFTTAPEHWTNAGR